MAMPRFTTRRLLWVFTVLTVLIAALVAIEEARVRKKHDIEVEGYRGKREIVESLRSRLSPDSYERSSRELDAEAKRLGIEE